MNENKIIGIDEHVYFNPIYSFQSFTHTHTHTHVRPVSRGGSVRRPWKDPPMPPMAFVKAKVISA